MNVRKSSTALVKGADARLWEVNTRKNFGEVFGSYGSYFTSKSKTKLKFLYIAVSVLKVYLT